MTASTIGAVRLDGRVTCALCSWSTTGPLDPVGALTVHRRADHPHAAAVAPEPSRHAAGTTLGIILLAVFGLPAAAAWVAGGWWIPVAIPCTVLAALGAYGAATDAQRAPRDARGRRLR